MQILDLSGNVLLCGAKVPVGPLTASSTTYVTTGCEEEGLCGEGGEGRAGECSGGCSIQASNLD